MPFYLNSSPITTTTVSTTLSRFSGGTATADSLVLTNYNVAAAAMAAGMGGGDQLVFTSGNDLFVWDDYTASSLSRAKIGGGSRLAQTAFSGLSQNQAIDVFSGGDGNDVFSFTSATGAVATYDQVGVRVNGDAGNDVIWAAGGNDALYGGDGNDWIDGGLGIDNIFGDAGNDTLKGNAGDDYIYGGTGNDTMWGDDGNDNITAGGVSSTVWGGLGNDTISGGAGNDTLYGDAGNDVIAGGGGDNTMFGGIGNDLLNASGGNRGLLDGGAGNDTLWGGIGDNVMWGGDGSDIVQTYGGNDYLYGGGTGNSGTGSVNTLWGGAGDDWYYIGRTDGFNTIADGQGNDNLVLYGQFATSGPDMFVAGTGVRDTTGAQSPLGAGYVLGSNGSANGVDMSFLNGSGMIHLTFAGGASGVDFYQGQIKTITLWNSDLAASGYTQEVYNWTGSTFIFHHYE